MDAQPPQVREIFQYVLATMLMENGSAHIIERHVADEREHLMIAVVDGGIVSVVKPQMSDDLHQQLLELARNALRNDSDA